jgi:hypothetical protein
MATSLLGGTAKRIYVTDNAGCGVEVWQSGCVVVWRIQANFVGGPAWSSKVLATGLPPALFMACVPIVIQGSADEGAVVSVDEYGQLIIEPKGNDLSSSTWIFASGVYLTDQSLV